MCYVILIVNSKKLNLNTILYFDFHQGCAMIIHVILQVKGSSSTLLLFVMSCYVFMNTSSKKNVALIGLWILLSTKLNAKVEDEVKHEELSNLYNVRFWKGIAMYNSLNAFVVPLEHLKQFNIFIYSMWFVKPLKEKYLVVLMLWVFASLQCDAMFKYPSMELFVMGKV